ncbi:MAG: hypothetical protein ABI619_04905 [Betaproteobacteria bacterium]
MTANGHTNGHKPASLSAQVTLAERQVLQRRCEIRRRAAGLRQTLQRQILEPKILLWAAGLGFAAGELTRRKNAQPSAAEGEAPLESKPSLFDQALKISTIVRSLSATFNFP